MRLVFPHKTELETDIIIDFLNQENIKYNTKLVRRGVVDIYDIEVDTTYEYYMFINKLAKEKLEPYLLAMRCYLLPSYEPNEDKIIEETPVTVKITNPKFNGMEFTFTPFIPVCSHKQLDKKPKESILYKLIKKWIK